MAKLWGTCLAFAVLLLSSESIAQTIESVSFKGLKKTDHSFLEKFLNFEIGDQLDSSLVETTRQNLANLEVLYDAQFDIKETKGGVEIIFDCQELFSLLPILNFGGIDDNLWFQAGFVESNLMGKGHKLIAYYQYYDRHSFVVYSSFRRIFNTNWDVNINLVKWSTLEPLFFSEGLTYYNYDNYTGGLTATKNFSFNSKLEFGGALFQERYNKAINQISEITPGPESETRNKILIKAIYDINHINYHFFYQDGFSNTTNAESVASLDGDPLFSIVFNDVKYFKRVKNRGNLAFRFRAGLSTNEESPFAPFVLDSYINIRGVGNRVDRGTGMIVLNSEYRHAFIDRNIWAAQGVLYADTGTWRLPGGTMNDFVQPENMELFAGVGLRLIYKKAFNSILRIDYGVDIQNVRSQGYVLGIGQYF